MYRNLRSIRLVFLAGMFLLIEPDLEDLPGRQKADVTGPLVVRKQLVIPNYGLATGRTSGSDDYSGHSPKAKAGHPELAMVPRPPEIPWQTVDGGMTDTLAKVRHEAGILLKPDDFRGAGTVGTALSLLGVGVLQFPSWMRVDLVPTISLSGYSVDVNMYFRWRDTRLSVSVWNTKDQFGTYPGVELQLLEFPVEVSRTPILISPRFQVRAVPTDEGVPPGSLTLGFLEDLTVEVPLEENLWLWVEGKDESLAVPGTLGYIPPLVTFRTGLHWSL